VRRNGLQYYKWQADRCRELAQRQTQVAVKVRLLETADKYDQLAAEAVRQK
jgi:hypothetical protein